MGLGGGADPAQGFFAPTRRGDVFSRHGRGTGDDAGFAGGECTPHSLFGLAKKRMGGARWKRKNVSRWGSVSGFRKISARGVVRAGVLEVPDTLFFFLPG